MSTFPSYDLSRLKSSLSDGPILRSALCALARWAHKSQRWDDLCRITKEIVKGVASGAFGPPPPPTSVPMSISGLGLPPISLNNSNSGDPRDLTSEERKYFVDGFKQLVGGLKSSWKSSKLEPIETEIDLEYQNHIEREIYIVCTELTNLLENSLLPAVTAIEPKVFYCKLAGDFYRYLAEIQIGILGISVTIPPILSFRGQEISPVIAAGFDAKSAEFYSVAHKLAATGLDSTHPSRLSVSLNYSILLYEIVKDKQGACEIARQAFDSAITRMDEMEEIHYKDSTLLMQLIRDNLTLWTAFENEQQQQQQQIQQS